MRTRTRPDRTLTLTLITAHTVTVSGPKAAWHLDQAGAPKQYDGLLKCWTTSRQALQSFDWHLQQRGVPFVFVDTTVAVTRDVTRDLQLAFGEDP